MKAKEILEIVALQRMVESAVHRAENSIIHHQLEGMSLALELVLLMESDPAAYVAEKNRLLAGYKGAARGRQ